MQREESPTMTTGLERIAARARCEPKLRFTSLTHHITKERVWENLCQITTDSAPGVDGQTVPEAKESYEIWIEAMLQSCTVRDIKRRTSGGCISRNPESRRNAHWACFV